MKLNLGCCGVSPLERVADAALAAEARGRLAPSKIKL